MIQRLSISKRFSAVWAGTPYDSAHRLPPMLEELVELLRYRDLMGQLVARNLTIRYKRSVLGVAWTMLNPMMMMVILTVVFSNVFRISVEHYAVYVLSGLILWDFFRGATIIAMNELVWGGKLFHRIYMPRTAFAVAALGTTLLNLVLSLIPLAVIMLVTGVSFHPALLFLPVPILLTAMFTLGMSLFMSALAVYFADMFDIHQIVISAWMYLTPIIYPPEIVPAQFKLFLTLNPMYYLLDCFRAPIYAGALPGLDKLAIAFVVATVTLVFGWGFFARRADEFAYRI